MAVDDPSRTVTLLGTDAAVVLLLVSVTRIPPAGALPFSATVPVELLPPVTVEGLRESDDSEGGLTVKVAVRLMVPAEAVITTVV